MAGDILPITLPHRTTLAKFKARGNHFDWLNMLSLDTITYGDDFIGDIAIATREPGYDTGNNGTSSAVAALDANSAGGTASMVTGTDDNGDSLLACGAGLHLTADMNPRFSARIKLSAITTVKCEIGFTDVGSDRGAINALDTPTATANDAVVAIFDTDATEDNWQFAGVRSTTAWSDATVDVAPVAATYTWITVALNRVDLATDNVDAYLYIDGVLKASKKLDAISNTAPILPWVYVQARAGSASRTLTIDRWFVIADRKVGGLSI